MKTPEALWLRAYAWDILATWHRPDGKNGNEYRDATSERTMRSKAMVRVFSELPDKTQVGVFKRMRYLDGRNDFKGAMPLFVRLPDWGGGDWRKIQGRLRREVLDRE